MNKAPTTHLLTHSRTHCGRHSAKTLVEMLVVITTTSVILSLAATTLIALFRIERQTRADAAQAETLARLSSRWRADAHAATNADVDDACELYLADGRTVRYAFDPPQISREVRRGQTIVHRDAFILPDRAQVTFSAAGDTGGKVIRLVITQADLPARRYTVPVRPATIAAAVNLHRQPVSNEEAP